MSEEHCKHTFVPDGRHDFAPLCNNLRLPLSLGVTQQLTL